MEPEHLAQHDISALAWDTEKTPWKRRKTNLHDWIQAFLVVELNQGACQYSEAASGAAASAIVSILSIRCALPA
jgi:hypothetical protein